MDDHDDDPEVGQSKDQRRQPPRSATKAYQRVQQPLRPRGSYCRAYTDGGYKRELRSKDAKASFGARLEFSASNEYYALELCGQVLKYSVGVEHSNNVGEFAALREAAMVALQQDDRIIDFYTDSFLLYQTRTAEP